jgi:DNA-directed RNA polymerase specialized sigma24 family protein
LRAVRLPGLADLARRVEDSFDEELLQVAMARVRGRVAPQTWGAFQRVALDGQSGADAGRALGMPVAHVFVARHRVQKMLRREVRRLEETSLPDK